MGSASGNGKVILFGEYAVLSGVTGFAVALKDFITTVTLPDGFYSTDLDVLHRNARIESNIPIRSGLGSSAALSVAYARLLTNDPEKQAKLAKEFEDFYHKGSSGIDTFTSLSTGLCSLSGFIKFTKLPSLLLVRLKRFNFSIINTNVHRAVQDVKDNVVETNLSNFIPIATQISKTFQEKLENDRLTLTDLIDLFNHAQSALTHQLKVSIPLINSITTCLLTRFPALIGIKITGAGWGGCLLAVHDDAVTESELIIAIAEIDENVQVYYKVEFVD